MLGSDRYSWPAAFRLDRQVVPRLPDDGIFLEVGANDGFSQSNTYRLERFEGWKGILIEPHPKLARRAARWRPASVVLNSACISDDRPDAYIDLVDIDLMSVSLGLQQSNEEKRRLDRAIEGATTFRVPAATISTLIDRSGLGRPTFMSVDVEGAEHELLAGLDLDRHTPDYLLIETGDIERVEKALQGHLKRVEQMSKHDFFFERC
ncbi:FkbM family methyltransferase [Actinomycetospora endophytica]|uniref:FkbM family methyltransferase n=1 Tax=Actinomycetospora endophytica TaxID=2291215 RepID=UPI0035575F1D